VVAVPVEIANSTMHELTYMELLKGSSCSAARLIVCFFVRYEEFLELGPTNVLHMYACLQITV
jgi:uncharacterized protein (DUF2235 family)